MPVGELLARMSGREIAEWMAYYRIEPWGEERGDLRSGVLASIVCNALRGKGDRVRKPQEFVLKFGGDVPDREDPKRVFATLKAMFKAVNSAQGEATRK